MTWTECRLPHGGIPHSFFRYAEGDKRNNPTGDKFTCTLCWYQSKRNNNTLHVTPGRPIDKTQSTPEKDTL